MNKNAQQFPKGTKKASAQTDQEKGKYVRRIERTFARKWIRVCIYATLENALEVYSDIEICYTLCRSPGFLQVIRNYKHLHNIINQ